MFYSIILSNEDDEVISGCAPSTAKEEFQHFSSLSVSLSGFWASTSLRDFINELNPAPKWTPCTALKSMDLRSEIQLVSCSTNWDWNWGDLCDQTLPTFILSSAMLCSVLLKADNNKEICKSTPKIHNWTWCRASPGCFLMDIKLVPTQAGFASSLMMLP